jgi:hypothetical protein
MDIINVAPLEKRKRKTNDGCKKSVVREHKKQS